MIPSWSHSKLTDFEQCKHRAWLKHDQRVPEPERPLPPGRLEHANDRGTRIHGEIELYIRGEAERMPPEADKSFGFTIDFLRELHQDGLVSMEGEWGLDQEWAPCDWKSAWHRSKLDVIVHWSPTHATLIDWKTGRKFGNEIKHGEQVQLYQLNAFVRYPELEEVETVLAYIDQHEATHQIFRRQHGLRFLDRWHRRGMALTTCTEFPPNPSIHACKWCPYKHTEHCTVGV